MVREISVDRWSISACSRSSFDEVGMIGEKAEVADFVSSWLADGDEDGIEAEIWVKNVDSEEVEVDMLG